MMRKIFEYPFQLVGAQTLLVPLEAYDLTRAEEITSEIEITAATTAAGDTVDVEFQETPDGVEWNTRIHHTAQVGNSGASLTTPESERITLLKWPAGTTDQIYEPTGSRGASDLAAPGVRHGPMLGRRPNRAATYRVKFVLVNATSVGFSGTYTLWIDTEA